MSKTPGPKIRIHEYSDFFSLEVILQDHFDGKLVPVLEIDDSQFFFCEDDADTLIQVVHSSNNGYFYTRVHINTFLANYKNYSTRKLKFFM